MFATAAFASQKSWSTHANTLRHSPCPIVNGEPPRFAFSRRSMVEFAHHLNTDLSQASRRYFTVVPVAILDPGLEYAFLHVIFLSGEFTTMAQNSHRYHYFPVSQKPSNYKLPRHSVHEILRVSDPSGHMSAWPSSAVRVQTKSHNSLGKKSQSAQGIFSVTPSVLTWSLLAQVP